MVDSKTVVSQVQKLQVIIHEIHAEGMVLVESFQVALILEKLPPAWKYFKNYLKHKRKEISMEDLVVTLCIEEDKRRFDKKGAHSSPEVKGNKEKGSKLGLKGRSPRSKSSKGNASIVGSKVISLLIINYQRETNPRKPMWLVVSQNMSLTSTSQ